MLDNGADINKGTISPIYAVCDKENVDVEALKLLIEKGADINKGWQYPNGQTRESPLFALVKHYIVNINAVNLLISNSTLNPQIGEQDESGKTIRTPFMLLYQKRRQNNNSEIIELFIRHNADIDIK